MNIVVHSKDDKRKFSFAARPFSHLSCLNPQATAYCITHFKFFNYMFLQLKKHTRDKIAFLWAHALSLRECEKPAG